MSEKELFNIEAEQSILGTIILYNVNYAKVSDILEAKHFYYVEHQAIFQRIADCFKKDELAVDRVTLGDFFENNDDVKKLGGKGYLKELLACYGIIDIRDYARLVVDLWRKRELQSAINEINQNLHCESFDNLLVKLEESLNKIDDLGDSLRVYDGEEMSIDWAASVEKGTGLKPIKTNLPKLDEMINGGLYAERLYVFGAASGCGKTFFAQNIILNALKLDFGTLFVSMEMPKKNIFSRFVSILARINSFRVSIGNFFEWEKEKFSACLKEWEKYQKKFFITEKGCLTVKQIEYALKKALRKSPIGLVVVDYAQILRLRDARNINEASLIKENITALAEIAKKYKVAVLLLSQLTKDKIGGKVGLGSLKGSGGLYEDADCVIAMWADEKDQKNDKLQYLQVEVIKNREGLMGGLSIVFNGDIGEFRESNF